MQTIQLMQEIDADYRRASGLDDPRFYKIYYSRIDPAPILILGINPGGAPDQAAGIISASESYFENFEHDYVDCDYTIQRAMLPFLQFILGATRDEVRRLPKTNLAFRRSPGEDDFRKYHEMSLGTAMKEAKPALARIISNVQPQLVLLETMKPEAFSSLYCGGDIGEPIADTVMVAHRGKQVRAFQARLMPVHCLDRSVPVVAIGHPSSTSFSAEPVRSRIAAAVRAVCEKTAVCFR